MKRVFAITWMLTITMLATATSAAEPSEKDGQTLAQIIQAVRENEQLYRNLETTVRRTTDRVDRDSDDHRLHRRQKETHHTIRQGDLIRYEGEESRTPARGMPLQRKRVSSFDGERTVSVEYDNSVNIQPGRYEASQVVPPHCWAVTQWGVNFPLSVLLEGTESLHKHPKFRSHPIGGGGGHEFKKVECRLEGMEEAEGMPCVKIRCDRWTRSTGEPAVSYLWLATQRNYLCVKSQNITREDERVGRESVVETFRQIAPGVWLPERVVTDDYTYQPDGESTVRWRETINLTQAIVEPAHPGAFFNEVDIPDDLPIFTIEDGILQGSPAQWEAAASSDQRLGEIVEAVRANERHYADIEIENTEQYRELGQSSFVAADTMQYSLMLDGRTFFSEDNTTQRADGTLSRSTSVRAFDGQWTRSSSEYFRDGDTRFGSSLRQGWAQNLSPFRPQAIAVGPSGEHRSLAELLTAESDSERDPQRTVEYLVSQSHDGLDCEVIRLALVYSGRERPGHTRVVWLAKDRNYIAVRTESYTCRWSERLPAAVTTVDDLREIAPGVWFPFHLITNRFEGFGPQGVCEGRLIASWQREYLVQRVARDPRPSPEIFTSVSVPVGTNVSVRDADGESLGTFVQLTTGNISITPEELASRKAEAEARK